MAVMSDWVDVTSGVTQGTILGPTLFLIYVNDICLNVNSSCRLYADDCVLYREMHSNSDAIVYKKI